MDYQHVTVLLEEMVKHVLIDRSGLYVDCTLGGGGHSLAVGEQLSSGGFLIGIDQDEEALKAAQARLRDLQCSYRLVHGNFSDIVRILDDLHVSYVDGFMFDLGVSSRQLDEGERGFSYMHNGKLDMRMNRQMQLTAYDVVNTYEENKLAELIKRYGEEKWAKRIARFILRERVRKPVETTAELVDIIKAAIPFSARREGPHPAKRTFQAIRIEVNNELEILEQALRDSVSRLKKGGRIGVITFQSLEDRIVKNTFRDMERGCVCPPEFPVCVCGHKPLVRLVGKPVKPSEREIIANPRSRSAVLRVAERV